MSCHDSFKDNLQMILRFNYGLNKLGLHPFVSTRDPEVRRKLRAAEAYDLETVRNLIEEEPSLLTNKARVDHARCAICDEYFNFEDEITRHKVCNGIAHRGCLELWYQCSPQCPCCRVSFNFRNVQAFRIANEKLQKSIESAHDPVAALKLMINRVNRMTSCLSTNELFALHTTTVDYNDDRQGIPESDIDMADSDDEMDFGEFSENEEFDWDDE